MNPQTSDPAHTAGHIAAIISWIGIGAGLFLLAALALIEASMRAAEPGTGLLVGPFDNLAVGTLVGLVVASLIAQFYLRLRRGQRCIIEAQQHLAELVDQRYAEGYTDATAGRPAAPLRIVRDPAHHY